MATGKIAPISKEYSNSFNSIDQQLAKNGYPRFPGTSEMLLPYKETSGRYRTGLDEDAPYLDRLSKEDKEAEILRIREAKTRLEKALNIPGILSPTSPFYNISATAARLEKEFGNPNLKVNPVKLGTTDEIFNMGEGDIMKEITWNWVKVHPRVAPSLDAYRRGDVPADIKYYVVDDEAETREVYSKKREVNQAIVAFENLTPTKKKQIARLMGLPVTESTKEENVYNLIDSQLKESEFRDGINKGYSPVKLFKEFIAMTDDRLKVKDLVEQAITHNVYRLAQGGKITEGGVSIAISKEELVTKLLDEKNQIDLIALEKKLQNKKIEKS